MYGGHWGPRQVGVGLHSHSLLGVVLAEVIIHRLHPQGGAVLIVTKEPQPRSLVELVICDVKVISSSLDDATLPPCSSV